MENKALKIVLNYIHENISWKIDEDDLFITWSCYILGNRKYLIGCTYLNTYFEVTFNKEKDEWYLDVYDKKHNKLIPND